MPHTCHWTGCTRRVPPALWGCKIHWFTLPKILRDEVWATYVPGQEIRKDPSPEYLAVMMKINDWIAEREKRKKQSAQLTLGIK
jgi:hypothetical protein